MYAYIRRYRVGRGTIEDLMARVETQFAGQLATDDTSSPVRVPEGIVDFRAIDTGDRTVATNTTFATREQYLAADQGAEAIRLSLADFGVEVIDTYGGPIEISTST